MGQTSISILVILAIVATSQAYEVGTELEYDYLTTVILHEPPSLVNSSKSAKKDVGYQVTATVTVASIWQNPEDPNEKILEITVAKPQLAVRSRKIPDPDGFVAHSSKLDSLKGHSVFVDWQNGVIKRIFAADNEPLSLLNVKRGIASLFQYTPVTGARSEVDASGRCHVEYALRENRSFRKAKENCQLLRPVHFHYHSHPILGLTVQPDLVASYQLSRDGSHLESVSATEIQSVRVTARLQVGTYLKSSQFLTLKGLKVSKTKGKGSTASAVVEALSRSRKVKYVEESLQVEPESDTCTGGICKDLTKLVQEIRSYLKATNMATVKMTAPFVVLIRKLRHSPKEDILAVLKDVKNRDVLPQLLDALAAAQTPNAHYAAMETLSFKSKTNIDLPERYLLGLSLATHPEELVIQDLVALNAKGIPSEKLAQSLLLTITKLTKTFCAFPGNCLKKVVGDVKAVILDKLSSCGPKDSDCRHVCLRALKNLALEDTMPLILEYVAHEEPKTQAAAVKTLQAMPDSFITSQVKSVLEKVYFQLDRKYDSSARTLSLDILLKSQPSLELVQRILESLDAKADGEISIYALQRIREFAGKDAHVQQLWQTVKRQPAFNNYHIMGQAGLSTAFTRTLTSDLSGNSTFSSSMEIGGGLLKRSAFDVVVQNQDSSLQLLSLGIYTGGLGKFSGAEEVDDEEPTAGMELTLNGAQLRPIVFFTGNGELMGHVWSGTASERTTALQATVLLQDHYQVIPLQSGFPAVLDVLGVISFDFAGQIQISLWYKNAHSLVENEAAVQLDGNLKIDTSFVQSQVSFDVSAQSKIDFKTDVDFSDDVLMCLQMSQPPFVLKHDVYKQERIPGSKHRIHKAKRRSENIPGRTFALNQKNSELCNIMFKRNTDY